MKSRINKNSKKKKHKCKKFKRLFISHFPHLKAKKKIIKRSEEFSSTPQLSNSNDFLPEFVVLINFVSIFFSASSYQLYF